LRPGFTLLELMISLTIMGLILVLVFGAFRIGSRAWEKGEKDVEAHQRERIVLELLKRQIASASPRQIRLEDQEPFYMRGDSRTLEFTTCVPALAAGKSGMVYVRYEVREAEADGGKELLLYEKDMIRLATDKDRGDWAEDDAYLLIPEAEEIDFAYLRPAKDEEETSGWQDRWDPEKDPGLPLAVRVTYRTQERAAPLVTLARVTSQVQ
jgi:general secretion pathway protein J